MYLTSAWPTPDMGPPPKISLHSYKILLLNYSKKQLFLGPPDPTGLYMKIPNIVFHLPPQQDFSHKIHLPRQDFKNSHLPSQDFWKFKTFQKYYTPLTRIPLLSIDQQFPQSFNT